MPSGPQQKTKLGPQVSGWHSGWRGDTLGIPGKGPMFCSCVAFLCPGASLKPSPLLPALSPFSPLPLLQLTLMDTPWVQGNESGGVWGRGTNARRLWFLFRKNLHNESQKESKAVHRYNCPIPPEKCHGQVHTDWGCFLKRRNLHTARVRDAKERGI